MVLRVHLNCPHLIMPLPTPVGEETPYTLLIRNDWDKWYPHYLDSPEWKQLRRQVLVRANGRCEKCGALASEVHHKTYVHVGNEALEDLVALCSSCHRKIHKKSK